MKAPETGQDVAVRAVLAALTGDRTTACVIARSRVDPRVRERILRGWAEAGPMLDELGIEPAPEPPRYPRIHTTDHASAVRTAVHWAAAHYDDDSVATGEAMRCARASGWMLLRRETFEAIRLLRQRGAA